MANKTKKPKIGVALGGGGAKGFAHIGVLKVLKEHGIHFDVISGTSIGSLVGAVYANGSLDKFADEVSNIKLVDIPGLLSLSWSTNGFFSGKKAMEFIKQFVDTEQIEELNKPFAAVASNINTGEIVTLSKGSIVDAVRASIAIPLVFTPVEINGMVLTDGGLVEPLPVRAARELGADIVIAIDLFGSSASSALLPDSDQEEVSGKLFTSPEFALSFFKDLSSKFSFRNTFSKNDDGGSFPSVFEVLDKTLTISQCCLTELRLRETPPDYIIRPGIHDLGLLDFHHGTEGIKIGEEAAHACLDEIGELLESS